MNMGLTFLFLYNIPATALPSDERRPMKINKRDAAFAVIP